MMQAKSSVTDDRREEFASLNLNLTEINLDLDWDTWVDALTCAAECKSTSQTSFYFLMMFHYLSLHEWLETDLLVMLTN